MPNFMTHKDLIEYIKSRKAEGSSLLAIKHECEILCGEHIDINTFHWLWKQGQSRVNEMTIKKPVGASMVFTGGAESSVVATIGVYIEQGSLHNGEKTINLSSARRDLNCVQVSPGTMRAILKWAEED